MINNVKVYSIWDHIANITLMFLMLYPRNSVFYYGVPVLIILNSNLKQSLKSVEGFPILVIFSMLFSLIINIFSPWLDLKSVLSIIELGLLFICFRANKGVCIIKWYLICILLYLLIFQISELLGIQLISNIKNNIYIIDEDELRKYAFYSSLKFEDIGSYSKRLGGIYYNSNNYAFVLELVLILLIIEKEQFKKYEHIFYVILCVFSLMLSGSRTSFIVLVVILGGYFLYIKYLKLWIKLLITMSLYIFISYSSNFRIFQVQKGLGDSFGTKIKILFNYLNIIESPLKILFGCVSSSATKFLLRSNFAGADFEFGNIIINFGFFFLILIMIFYYRCFKILKKEYYYIFPILLWSFSNTILMNYRFSAIIIFILGIYCKKSSDESEKMTLNN